MEISKQASKTNIKVHSLKYSEAAIIMVFMKKL